MKLLYRNLSLTLLTTLLALSAQAANFPVDCRRGGSGLNTISAAIAVISQKATQAALGPNTITVTGPCVENLTITSLDNLTLQASPTGASISDASAGNLDTVAVGDSHRFALNGFTINGSVDCFDDSTCRLNGNTLQNSQTGYALRASRSKIDSVNDSISNNPSGDGVLATNQSIVLVVNDTISNNGNNGISVANGSFVQIGNSPTPTTVSNNAAHGILAANHGTVLLGVANVTGNAIDGIRVQNGSVLRTVFVSPLVINITGNGAAGVNLGDLSHAFFAAGGSVNITGNLGGTDVYCAGQFAATRNVASVGGSTNCKEPNPN